MSAWIIYDKNGLAKCEARRLEYQGDFMGACSVNVSVSSPAPIKFELGDWLEYRGERFELNYDPSVVKESSSDSYGEGFQYENIVFNSLSDELTRCDFLDYVPKDNEIHYSSLPTFSFFADSIDKLAERIQVNLDRIYTGEKKWTVEVHGEYVNTLNINVTANNNTVWDALGFVNTLFKANFIIRGRKITIGTTGLAVGQLFSYGKGNGLFKIEKNADSGQKIITRLRAYGSTRNLPTDYYHNVEGGNVPNNMAIRNLMLPAFPSETHDPYIDSANVSELGVREGTVFFDGSSELEEIYPTMEGMTAEDLSQAGIKVDATGALDAVVSAEQIADNGKFEDGTDNIPDFTITLKDIGFDINDYLSTSTATISMKDGMCGGREFEIVKCEKEDNRYVLTCHRHYDSSLDLYFPYNDYQIKGGDKFVLLNIEMPDVYIKAASQRLLTTAKAYLAQNDYVRYSYSLSVDNIFMARQHDEAVASNTVSIHDTIKEGDLMLFEDSDLGVNGGITISSLTIKEDADGSIIPEYGITLQDEKTVGTIQKIQNQINSLATSGIGGGSLNTEQLQSIIAAYGPKIFLSKTKDDRSKGKIASDKAIEVGNYVSGASGAIIYKDEENGQTVAEFDKLYVRMKAYFETLEIINVNTIGGKQIISPAGSVKCIGVEETDNAYRCYFLAEQDGEKVQNRWKNGDQAYSQMFNAKAGVSNNISNKYYWRLVTSVSSDSVEFEGKQCHYIALSKTDCDAYSDIPSVGDVINQRGNRTDLDRMNFIEMSSVDAFSPNITLFHGVNSYSLDGKAYVSYGVDKSTNNAFMDVYGDMYVGDRKGGSYMRYTQENGLEISGTLSVGTKLGDTPLKDLISESSPEGYQEFVEKVTQDIEGLQNQIDGAIESYFYQYNPTLGNYPASDWVSNGTEKAHLNDTFTNLASGCSWRWSLDGTTYKWVEITDTATTKALALAGQAKDTADGKRRVFVEQPKPDYDKGDLWSRGSEYPMMICINGKSKAKGEVYEASDWDYADNNAKLKEEMQDLVNDTKDDLNNAIGQAKNEAVNNANAYTDEGKKALQASIDAMESSKANLDDVYTRTQADGKISDSETNAINAAKEQADAAIALSEITIKAYADGIVDKEEAARIKQAQENLEAAKKYAEKQAQQAIDEANDTYGYLARALGTEVDGGLLLTSLIQMRDTDQNIKSGINGLTTKGDTSIATWWGGGMYDMSDYYDWDGAKWVAKKNIQIPTNIPSGLIRMDGTGYLAKGKFWWDNNGKIYADPTALFLMFDVEDEAKSLSTTILSLLDKQKEFEDMWLIKKDANGNEYIYSKYHIATQYGMTMYGDSTTLNIPSIYNGLPIDGDTIYWDNGILKAKGSGGISGQITFKDIANVGTWADSVADVDRIMYQQAGSSNWVAKSLSSIGGGGGVSGDYLPLSGGTLTGALNLPINTYNYIGNDLSLWVDSSTPAVLRLYSPNNVPNIAFFDKAGWCGTLSLTNRDILKWNDNTLLHSGNYSSYALPLTGGKISGTNANVLDINSTNANEVGIRFMMSSVGKGWIGYSNSLGTYLYNNSSASYLSIKDDGSLSYSKGTIWHSGNDGSGSGLDADLLDGKHNGELTALVLSKYSDTWNYSLGNPGLSVFSDWNNTQSLASYFYGISIEPVDGRFRTAIATPLGMNGLYWRRYHEGSWLEDWRCLIDSYNIGSYNAGSATKLQTARTIWGQSFDGTGNVDGKIKLTSWDSDGVALRFENSTAYESFISMYAYDGNAYTFGQTTNRFVVRHNTYGDIFNIVSGNVGIGTTSPAYKLDVKGTVFARSYYFAEYNNTSTSAGYIGVPHTSNNNIAIVSTTSSAIEFITSDYNVPKMIVMPNGNVGIGGTNPEYKLHVFGDIRSYNLSTDGINAKTLSMGNYIKLHSNNWTELWVNWGGAEAGGNLMLCGREMIFHCGNVAGYQVGMKLDASSNLLVYGGITMYSQRSLKNVIDERGLSLTELSTIKPTRYTWKDNRDDRLHIGGIADDIQQVLPEVVYKTGDNVLTMDYGNAAFAIASSLIKPVIDHERRIEMLERENKELRMEVERLRAS